MAEPAEGAVMRGGGSSAAETTDRETIAFQTLAVMRGGGSSAAECVPWVAVRSQSTGRNEGRRELRRRVPEPQQFGFRYSPP